MRNALHFPSSSFLIVLSLPAATVVLIAAIIMKYEKFPIASLKKRRCACNRRMWMTYPPTVYQPTTYQMPVTYFSQKQWFIQYEQNIPRTTACVWLEHLLSKRFDCIDNNKTHENCCLWHVGTIPNEAKSSLPTLLTLQKERRNIKIQDNGKIACQGVRVRTLR